MNYNRRKSTEKAYKNIDFLNSSEARSIRILSEFVEPRARFRKYDILDTIVFFGSARLKSQQEALKEYNAMKKTDPKSKNFVQKLRQSEVSLEMSKYYEDAAELSQMLTKWSMELPTKSKRFIICSGGGPGIMEAANKGAKLAGGYSIGLNISLPFEQFVNKYVPDELSFEFHYFFMRKFWFAYLAKTLVVFPGGFGTFDEVMEILTLLQTEKIKKELKVIIYGEKFWKEVINFEALLDHGLISKSDLKLFTFCSEPRQAFGEITKHLEKFYLNNGRSGSKVLM
jgi:uncharacterized protein (TIGR00730 family)